MNLPATSGRVPVFELMVASLGGQGPGSFTGLMADISNGVKERALQESNNPQSQHPNEIEGKPVLPTGLDRFVVRVTNRLGRRVSFLFQWNNLYNSAFFVEDEANPCWYIYKDFFEDIALPPQDQFTYVPELDQGFHILDVPGNYTKLGIKEILVGPSMIDGYISKLHGIRTALQDGNRLVLGPTLRKELTNGPFTFAPVVISESCRFGEYQTHMITWVNVDYHRVPREYTDLFTQWGALSKAIKGRIGYKLTLPSLERVDLTPEQVKEKVLLLCNTVLGPS